jgi:hypothetical protein
MTLTEQLELLESVFPEADRIILEPMSDRSRWLICTDHGLDGEGYTNMDAYEHIPGTRQFRYIERTVWMSPTLEQMKQD